MNKIAINNTFIRIAILAYLLLLLSAFSTIDAEESNCLQLNSTLRFGGKQSKTDVSALQYFLINKNYLNVSATGYFGRATESAVKKFQKDNGLEQVGIVGPATRQKIKNISCTLTKNTGASQVATVIKSIDKSEASSQEKVVKLPFRSSDFSSWSGSWGNISTTTNSLTLKAGSNTSGAQSFFPESKNLSDYKYDASVFVKRGEVILIGRYVDDMNYVGCVFRGKNIDIIEKIDGNEKTVEGMYLPDSPYKDFFFNDLNISMIVKGRTVGCILQGNTAEVEYKNVNEKLLKGGVGIQSQYSSDGVSEAEVKSVLIQSV